MRYSEFPLQKRQLSSASDLDAMAPEGDSGCVPINIPWSNSGTKELAGSQETTIHAFQIHAVVRTLPRYFWSLY